MDTNKPLKKIKRKIITKSTLFLVQHKMKLQKRGF